MNRLTRVAGIVVSLQFALHADRRGWERDQRLEGRAGIALTITAVAEAAECRFASHSVADPPTQTATGDVSHYGFPSCLASPATMTICRCELRVGNASW